MKRYISILSLLAILAAGLVTAYAKTDLSVDDWDDDDDKPGNVTVEFLSVPKAVYNNLHLTLSTDTKGARIMWTLDASLAPEAEGWQTYTAPLYLTEDCKVRFYATLRPGACSEVQTYKFTYADHQLPAPVLTVSADGSHLVMSCTDRNAQIRYTVDGSEPEESSTLYSAPVEITSYVYRARAFAKGYFPSECADYTATDVSVITPAPVADFADKRLTLTCTEAGASIFYSLDPEADRTDANAWTRYSSPLALTEDCIVRFYATKKDYKDSDVQSFTFVLANYRAADPTIERDETGTFIVMETATEGGQIRYTTDGSEPTEKSSLYSGPILIEGNLTYKAKTFAKGLFESKTNRYVVTNMAVPVPYAVFGNKMFFLYCLDPKADIHYTTDPSLTVDDIYSWNLYTDPFELTDDCTLRFFTTREGFNDSDIETLTVVYADYQCVAPSIMRNDRGTHIVMDATPMDPPSGYIPGDGTDPVLSTPEIRYTTDGSDPTEESTLYTAPVRIVAGAVYRARVFDRNYYDSEITEYAIGDSSLPVPVAEFRNFALTLSCTDPDAGIWYTTDPDATVDHLENWILYTAPIKLTDDCTFRFFSGDDDDNASDVQSFVFQKADYTVAAPTVERSEDGLYVEMETATPEADIYYTMDGTVPTKESLLYTEPVLIPCNSTFIAKAFLDGRYDSEPTEFVVNNMVVPVAYASVIDKHLELTCSDAEAEIWYTTNAGATTDNLSAWKRYTAPVALSDNATYHFFTRREGFNDSDIESFVFLKANYQVATPSIDRTEDGTFVTMSCETEGAEIRYTLDGSEPTVKSLLYIEPVLVEGNTTYTAKAFAKGLFDSEDAIYTVSNMVVMEPYAVFENLMLTLMIGDPEAEIWYAVSDENAVRSKEEWKLYKEPIGFKGDCVVSYFGRRAGYNNSETKTFELVYADYQATAPEITLSDDEARAVITTGEPDAKIRYTMADVDVADPDENSAVYTAPLAFSEGPNIIKARVFVDGMFPSEVVTLSHTYKNPVSVEQHLADAAVQYTVREGVKGFEASEAMQLHVYNMQGVCVTVVDLQPGFTPLPALPAGVYFAAGVKFRY